MTKPFESEVKALKEAHLFKEIPVVESANDASLLIEGKTVLNLCSNNYLGFANHPRLKKAAIQAIETYGVGAGAVKVISGQMSLHAQLEKALAAFKREEAALLFQSGFNCNAGVIQAITTEEDLIISDELNHASIIDGIRLSKASRAVFKHSDMADLKQILEEKRQQFKTCLIITDGVFSMDGDLAKLPEIVKLAKHYSCLTYVDDAHGSGVLGEHGRGTVDHFNLHGQVDIIVGTLSKAFGVIGGYVACSLAMKEWLSQKARPLLFSTNLSPADTGALIEAVKLLQEDDHLINALWENGRVIKSLLNAKGFDIGHSETPITPVMIFDEVKAIAFAKALLEEGIFVSPIVFPTVPKGKARIRVMVSATHQPEQLQQAADVFESVAKRLGIL